MSSTSIDKSEKEVKEASFPVHAVTITPCSIFPNTPSTQNRRIQLIRETEETVQYTINNVVITKLKTKKGYKYLLRDKILYVNEELFFDDLLLLAEI